MTEELKDNLLQYYKKFKPNKNISTQEFISNVEKIEVLCPNFFENINEKLNEKIELFFENEFIPFSKFKQTTGKVCLKDIKGTYIHQDYDSLPWIIALPSLKRFSSNFPKNEEEKNTLFLKMQNNDFDDSIKIKLIRFNESYYILEGHHRIIICKNLGLDYLKSNIFYL